jgi:lipopolysaccharide assembly outer membrane protein LptD (OstA)
LLLKPGTYLLSIVVWIALNISVTAQINEQSDSMVIKTDSITGTDSISFLSDTAQIPEDTSQFNSDSTLTRKNKPSEINTKIVYSAKDSMAFSAGNKKIYLYGKAVVTYGDIELKADYIEYDYTSRIVFASGLPDSTGKIQGKPEFSQKKEKFKSEKLNYNFKTKKGIIYNIITDQGGGYLHAEKTKRLKNGQVDLRDGKYTTCNAEHPHFYLALKEGVMIPDDKIVFRSAYLVIEDVPIFPVFLPFGFFPNRNQNTSGIIMPTYGLESNKGYYLSNGGYFLAINDYTDVRITGTIYTNGSWNAELNERYVKRYKYSGHFDFRYAVDITGEQDITAPSGDALQTSKNYSITWVHTQDPKANPSRTFNASVLYQTMLYNRNQNYLNPEALTTNTTSSSVAFVQNWAYFVFSANLNLNQTNGANNTQTISGSLPNLSFNAKQSYYPFRRKNAAGTLKWYENIGLSYSSVASNNINTDTSLFAPKTFKTAANGFKQTVPVNVSIKLLKYFTITPSITYTGILQTTQVIKTGHALHDLISGDTTWGIKSDTIHQLNYTQGLTPQLAISFVQPWYGMFDFGKNSKITKIRHVITPNISFGYVPTINGLIPDYYRYYTNSNNTNTKYSIYDNTLYGSPPIPTKQANFNFGLNNNLEMKVKSTKDTITGEKKVVLIQSLTFASSYNIYKPAGQNLTPISFSGVIPVIKNLNLTFGGTFNSYAYKIVKLPITNSITNITRDTFEMQQSTQYAWQDNQWLGKLTSFSLRFGYTFQSAQPAKPANTTGATPNSPASQGTSDNQLGPDKSLNKTEDKKLDQQSDYNYFKIPWSVTFNYSFSLNNTPGVLLYNYSLSTTANPKTLTYKSTIQQNFDCNGNFSLTPKWKVTFSTAYDFQARMISYNYTNFSIQRDLHCWVMSIKVTPFGNLRSYQFTINPLSALLQDMKYQKHHSPADNPGYSLY